MYILVLFLGSNVIQIIYVECPSAQLWNQGGTDSGFPIGGANAVGGGGGASPLIHQWGWHSGAYFSNRCIYCYFRR